MNEVRRVYNQLRTCRRMEIVLVSDTISSRFMRIFVEQLKDAENLYKAAKTESTTYPKAKIDVGMFMARKKQPYQNLQQLQQMHREMSEKVKTLKMDVDQSNLEIARLTEALDMTIKKQTKSK